MKRKYKNRFCDVCGKEFSPNAARQIYCGKVCKYKANYLRRKLDSEYKKKKKASDKAYYLRNTEKVKESSKKYRDNNKEYIEDQMPNGKSIKDLGYYGYHIDHKIPLAKAQTKKEVIELCHYINLRPLWFEDNFKKHAKEEVK